MSRAGASEARTRHTKTKKLTLSAFTAWWMPARPCAKNY
jgi:hypothetical protein